MEFFPELIIVISFFILLAAVSISTSTTVENMLNLYQWQALMVAAIVLLTAFESQPINLPLAVVAILPISLALVIKPLLRRATMAVPEEPGKAESKTRPELLGADGEGGLGMLPRKPELTWLQQGRSRLPPVVLLGIGSMLTLFSFIVAYLLIGKGPQQGIDPNSVGISIALLLIGILIMSNKRDIIAQIIGLLVMEHGLFLAAIKVITRSRLAIFFAGALFFYILITLTILLWLLPTLHRVSGSIELDAQAQLKG